MNTITIFTNPFDESVNELIDFIDDVQIEHLYNSTYKVTCLVKEEVYIDTLALVTNINYSYLYFCTDIRSESLNDFIELYNNCIFDFIGLYATRFEVVYFGNKEIITVKLVPYIDQIRIYLSQNSISTFTIKYRDVLNLNNIFITLDPLFEYSKKILKDKNIVSEVDKVNNLIYGTDLIYADKTDMIIMKLKQENYFSLNEFKDDPLFLIMLEVMKAFEVIKVDDYIFRYISNPFQISIKNWIIKSSLRIINNQLPLYRFQVDNLSNNEDDMKIKIRLAAILSYLKIKNDINIDDIKVLDDMSVQIPILNMRMISIFNEYISVYLDVVDNWSVTLCPSFLQAVTLRNIVKKSKLGSFDSYILDDYLIILTDRSEIIKYSEDIPASEPTTDRGFITSKSEPLSIKLTTSIIKDCDGKDLFIVKYGKQDLLITQNEDEVDKFKNKVENIESNWIRFYAKEYNLMSNLLLFK
jgi:hypothetical protein